VANPQQTAWFHWRSIEGESRTGKELVTRQIHELSRRRRGPFVAINSAAQVTTLSTFVDDLIIYRAPKKRDPRPAQLPLRRRQRALLRPHRAPRPPS